MDGALGLFKNLSYLNTDIKVLLEASPSIKPNKTDADNDVYHFKSKYGQTWRTVLHLNINDVMKMYDLGYNQGDNFFKYLKIKHKEL